MGVRVPLFILETDTVSVHLEDMCTEPFTCYDEAKRNVR